MAERDCRYVRARVWGRTTLVSNASAARMDFSVVKRIWRRDWWVPSVMWWGWGFGGWVEDDRFVAEADGLMKGSGEVVGDVRRA